MSERDDEIIRRLLRALPAERSDASPDVTGEVMARLGFSPCTARQARRVALRRALRRGAVVVAILAAAGGGWLVAAQRPQPVDASIVPAMNDVIQSRSRSLNSVLDGMPRLHAPHGGVPVMRIRAVPLPPAVRDVERDPERERGRMQPIPARAPFPQA